MARVVIVLALLLVAMQLVPVTRDNPPEAGIVAAPPAVMAVLERSCFDCHSNRTQWPWYSRIAPVSWLVAYDVAEAREHANFTEWGALDAADRGELIEEVWEEVEEGEMPLWYYLPLHPEARLSDADRAALRAWAEAEGDGEGHHHD